MQRRIRSRRYAAKNKGKNRQAYLVQIEGTSDCNNTMLNMRDALEITEEDIKIKAMEISHFLVVEMKKG